MQKYLTNKSKVLIVLLVCVVVGCVLTEEPLIYKKRPIRLGHITHVTKEHVKCDACHRDASTSDKAGMPDPRMCRKCHQTDDEIGKFLRPFAPEKKLMWSYVSELQDDVIFSHKLHNEKKVECEACHKEILKEKFLTLNTKVEKGECIDCHAGKNVSGEC